MEQQVGSKQDELAEENKKTDAQAEETNASRRYGRLLLQDWMALGFAVAAVACAFLPWLQVNTILVDGTGFLSGMIDSWGNSGTTLPLFQKYYSIFAFPSLAETIGGYASLLKDIGAAGYIDTSEAIEYLDISIAAIYAIFGFWIMSVTLTIVGAMLYITGKGRRKAFFVAGLSLLTALALVWACAYNVIIACIDEAQYVIVGASPWSIACLVLGLAAIACIVVARSIGNEKQKRDVPGKGIEGSSHVGPKETQGFTRRAGIAVSVIVSIAVVVLLVVVVLVVVVPSYHLEESEGNSDAAAAENNQGSLEQSATDGDQVLIAATLGGEVLEEQVVTDYIDDFRSAQGLVSDSDWAAWMEEQGYTPDSVRDEVVEFFLDERTLEIACEENSVEVTQDDVDAYVAEVENAFTSKEEYQEALSESGMTEESYVSEVVVPALRRSALAEKVLSENEREDEEALSEWLRNYREQLGERINPMPEGLSYDVR